MRIFSLILISALLSGCQHPAGRLSDFGGEPPTKLAARIATADSIVVTSYFAELDKEHRDMRFIIKGATVRKIIRAASDAGLIGPVDNIPCWTLEFYRGTNNLDYICFEGHIFNYGGEHYEQYSDESKVLENLDAELTERCKQPQSK
jgi:hypothetical protein